jgi:class 3 adenylate cyclase/TolB-like protein/Tfp pilus assembly protein PilF
MRGERVERKLTAIMAADIAGYSRLMGVDEEGTLARLKATRRELGDPKIAEHRGRIVKTTGDGMLVEFQSVVDAVRCAVELQEEMAERNADLPSDRRIDFRIGVNVGDVIIDGDDIYGDGVNIAARLEALAEPGGVCISGRVHEDVSGKIDTSFEDAGERVLKNIRRPVRVYRMRRAVPQGLASPAPREGLRQTLGAVFRSMTRGRVRETAPVHAAAAPVAVAPADRTSILVLPFRNATGDPEQEYFTDAVTADLTIDLSRIHDITVISAASALTYKGSQIDTRRLARELRVRYLVVGAIARIRELVRTNVQLVEAATGEQLWGDRFENEFADLARLENAITGRIAASLNHQLLRAEGRRVEKSTHPDALDLRLRATSLFFGSISPENTLAARQLLQRSLSLDPSEAEAWARLAEVTISDHLNRWNGTGREKIADAEDAARKALSLDPNNALAHVANGLIYRAREEHHSAIESFTRAIELDPNFAFAYANKGAELTWVGRAMEAPAYIEQALRLSPHDPSIGIFYWILGRSYFFTEQYGDAVAWLLKSVQARPNLWYNRAYLASAYALLGKRDDAARALADLNRRFSDPVFTLAVVTAHESEATPSSDPVVVAMRDKFHEGLLTAGMAEE